MLYFRIEKREECEMIMMIGLPGSGKTSWVEKHVAAHPEKRYNVIGASVLQERMKVNKIFRLTLFPKIIFNLVVLSQITTFSPKNSFQISLFGLAYFTAYNYFFISFFFLGLFSLIFICPFGLGVGLAIFRTF